MHFDLTDLRLFSHVAEAGSITGGATRAHLSLAAASARIRGMETQAGVTLLERGGRGVALTPAVHALLRHARIVSRQLEGLRGEMNEYAQGLKGQVRLAVNTAAMGEIPEAIAAFLVAHPNVDVELDERPSERIVGAVHDDLVDAGIVADHADRSGLACFPFATDRLVVVVPPRHPLAQRSSVAFAALTGEDFVGLAIDSALHSHLGDHAGRLGARLRLRVRVRYPDAACTMVALGAGIAILPEQIARRRVGAIVIVPLEDAWATRRLVVVVKSIAGLPAHARQLVDHLLRAAAEVGASGT